LCGYFQETELRLMFSRTANAAMAVWRILILH